MILINKILLTIIICIIFYVIYKHFFKNDIKRYIPDKKQVLINEFEKKINTKPNLLVNEFEKKINIDEKEDIIEEEVDPDDTENKKEEPYKIATVDDMSQFSLNNLVNDDEDDETNMYKVDSFLNDSTMDESISITLSSNDTSETNSKSSSSSSS